MLKQFLGFFDFIVPARQPAHPAHTNGGAHLSSPSFSSSLQEIAAAIKKYPEGSSEHTVLANLRDLQTQVELTIMEGQKSFGKGIFALFDFIQDNLNQKELGSLRFYNRRSFVIFDKYLSLRDVHKDLNEQLSQLLTGFNRYPDMRAILIKGAEKAFDDAAKKYKSCKNIETVFDQPERISDFFDIIYEKFEKEIDLFFDSRINDVGEANCYYKLKTKFLDRRLKGLQQTVVKQNFEIANAKSFYKNEVSCLQEQIGDIKRDFSQNLADVRTSMIQFGFGEEDENNTSIPEVEVQYSHEDSKVIMQEEDSKTITSKTSTSKNSLRNVKQLTNQKLFNEDQKIYSSIRKSGSFKKMNEIYENMKKDTSIEKGFNLQTSISTIEKGKDQFYTDGKQTLGMRATFGSQMRDPFYTQDRNISRYSRQSNAKSKSSMSSYQPHESTGYHAKHNTLNNISQRDERATQRSRADNSASNSRLSKKSSDKVIPAIKQAVSDEDFSKILGGAMYLKGTTGEVFSESSNMEEDDVQTQNVLQKRQGQGKFSYFQTGSSTLDNTYNLHGSAERSSEDKESQKNVFNKKQKPQSNLHTIPQEVEKENTQNPNVKEVSAKIDRENTKCSFTFCQPSPAESRDCSKERPSAFPNLISNQNNLLQQCNSEAKPLLL